MKLFKRSILLSVITLSSLCYADQISGPGGTFISQIQNEGSTVTRRSKLNFIGSAIDCVDNSTNSRTDCTVTATGGGGGASTLEVFSNFDATRTSPTLSIAIGDSLKLTTTGSTSTIAVDFSTIPSRQDVILNQVNQQTGATASPDYLMAYTSATVNGETKITSGSGSPSLILKQITGSPGWLFKYLNSADVVKASMNLGSTGYGIAVSSASQSTALSRLEIQNSGDIIMYDNLSQRLFSINLASATFATTIQGGMGVKTSTLNITSQSPGVAHIISGAVVSSQVSLSTDVTGVLPLSNLTNSGIVSASTGISAGTLPTNVIASSAAVTMLVSSFPITGVTAGSYTNTNLTVDNYGRITAASNGSAGGGGGTTIWGQDDEAVVSNAVSTVTVNGVLKSTVTASGKMAVFLNYNTSQFTDSASTFTANSSSFTLYGPNIPAASISAGTLGSSVIASSAAVTMLVSSFPITGITAGSYTNTNLTVDAYGRLTAASNGSAGAGDAVLAATQTFTGIDTFTSTRTSMTRLNIRDSIHISTNVSLALNGLPPWGLYVGGGSLSNSPINFVDSLNDGVSFSALGSIYHQTGGGVSLADSGQTVAQFGQTLSTVYYPLTVNSTFTVTGGTISANGIPYRMPNVRGSSNQVLTTDGASSGIQSLTWATPAGSGDAILAATQTFSGQNTFNNRVVVSSEIKANQIVLNVDSTPRNSSILDVRNNGATGINLQGDLIHERFAAAGAGPGFYSRKFRGTLASSSTVAADDDLDSHYFQGFDGVTNVEAARILVEVDGTPGTNDMPGRISFLVTADGASSATEAMRISNNKLITMQEGLTVASTFTVTGGTISANGIPYRMPNVRGTSGKSLVTNGESSGIQTLSWSNASAPITIGINYQNGGSALSAGSTKYIELPYNVTVSSWSVFADQSCSASVMIINDTRANYPPTTADAISGTEKPSLSAQTINNDSNLTTWTTLSLTGGSILGFYLESVSTCTDLTVQIIGTGG